MAGILQTPPQLRQHLFDRELEDAGDEFVVAFGERHGRKQEQAVAGEEVDTRELRLERPRTEGPAVLFVRVVRNDAPAGGMESDGRPGLGDDGLGAAPAERGKADAHAVLRDALAVPIGEVAVGFLEEALERAGEAHIEPGPELARAGDDVPGECFARRCRPLGHDVELCSVVGGPLAVEIPGVGATVDRFVIDYRELANLEWFGQWTVPLAHRIGTGQLDEPLAHSQKGVPRQRRGKSLYHRLCPWNQPARVTRIGENPRRRTRYPPIRTGVASAEC